MSASIKKHNKLTDVGLRYQRSTSEDPDQRVSEQDCLAVHDRTVDWVSREFRQLDAPYANGGETKPNANTKAGNPYHLSNQGPEMAFLASGRAEMDAGRYITVMSHYIVLDGESISCDVGVDFSDADNIERWSLSPEEKSELETELQP